MTDTNEATTVGAKPATKRPRKMAREPKTESSAQLTPDASPAKRQTKADLVLGRLRRPGGATINQLVAATGWLPHTTRAALTGLKKKGHKVVATKVDKVTCYTIAAE